MVGKFAYSLNGEHYRGGYASREEAVDAAIEAARRSDDSPQTVYVGRIIPGDTKANGHARTVLANMAARAREEFGDEADGYLASLNRKQVEHLDEVLELVIRGWLHREGLMPTFFKVDAIGEYTVPTPAAQQRTTSDAEVQEIGSGEYAT